MVRSAAAVTESILESIAELDDPDEPLAEIARRVARRAEERGLTRPGYECLRVLIKEHRTLRRNLGPSALELFLLDGMGGLTPGLIDEIKKPRDERRPRKLQTVTRKRSGPVETRLDDE